MLDVLAIKKEVMDGKKAILSAHRNGAKGLETVNRFTELADNALKGILLQSQESSKPDTTRQRFAIIGVGGYGREELCPCSDIDLLTLHEGEMSSSAEQTANVLVPALWDIGFEVGHVFYTIRHAIDLIRSDITVKTNLIHSRLIWGDSSLFIKFKNGQWENTVRRDIDLFMHSLEEINNKTHEFPLGISQPNVKESPGGLRNLQVALWAAFARFGVYGSKALQKRGILTSKDLSLLQESLDFLLRVRSELHFQENRKNDVLVYEMQEKVATALRYEGNPQEKIMKFMRDYYIHASQMKAISQDLFSRSKNYRKGLLKRIMGNPAKKIKKGFSLSGDEIYLSGFNPLLFQGNPDSVMDIFHLCLEKGYTLNRSLKNTIRGSLDSINPSFFAEKKFHIFFISLLKNDDSTAILRLMHETGFLEKFLPEFQDITHGVHCDFYHAYTIDEHTFQALAHLETLQKSRSGILSQIYQGMKKKWIVKLALLLHDIGKSDGDDDLPHAQASANLAENICQRLGISDEESGHVVFLVKYHLVLNLAARRRDIHDPKTLYELSWVIETRHRLDMLYLVTYADMKGVAPGIWSNWFAFLLEDLYQRTADFINIDESNRPGDEEKVGMIKKRVLRYLPKKIPKDFAVAFTNSASTRYLTSIPIENIINHIFLGMTRKNEEPVIDIYYNWSIDCTEMIMISQSRLGNLNRVAGILQTRGLNILEAKIFIQKDSSSLDIIRFKDKYGKPVKDPDQIDRIKKDILLIIEKMKPPKKGPKAKTAKANIMRTEPRVEIKNYVSQARTVIEIEAEDRLGLIQSITYAFFKMGLNIHLAKIDTEGSRAYDSFYVTDKNTKSILDQSQLDTIKKALLEVL